MIPHLFICKLSLILLLAAAPGLSVWPEKEEQPVAEVSQEQTPGSDRTLAKIRENTTAGQAASNEDAEGTNLQLYAQSAILMDAGSGRILYEKNGFEPKPMASTTKIMTCILALEYGNQEDMVEVSSYAAGMPRVKLGMQQGEYFKLNDLLYSLMLESHNDSAVAIAEHIGGSVPGFAGMMNQKARDIGCYDTFFITPNGLDATATTEDGEVKTHATTAADLARIMSYCILDSPRKEEFLEITRTASYQFESYRRVSGEEDGQEPGYTTASGRSFTCSNHNAFLSMMEGALSGKTGFTGQAGYCYVGALQQGERTFVVALLACGWPNNRNYKWSDTRTLMNYGLANFRFEALADAQIPAKALAPLTVTGARTEQIGQSLALPVVTAARQEPKGEGVLLGESEEIRVVYDKKEVLAAPVEAGEEVGQIRYLVGDEVYRVDYIITADEAPAIDYGWCLRQIWNHYSL